MKKILGSFGILTCLASLLMTSAAVGDLISGTGDTGPGVLIGLLIFFGGTAIASGYLAKTQLTDDGGAEKTAAHSHETTVLELAMTHGGQLNIAQIAALSPLSVDEAQRAMKRLTEQGVAELEFTREGEIYYQFAGLQNLSGPRSRELRSDSPESKQRPLPSSQREL